MPSEVVEDMHEDEEEDMHEDEEGEDWHIWKVEVFLSTILG